MRESDVMGAFQEMKNSSNKNSNSLGSFRSAEDGNARDENAFAQPQIGGSTEMF